MYRCYHNKGKVSCYISLWMVKSIFCAVKVQPVNFSFPTIQDKLQSNSYLYEVQISPQSNIFPVQVWPQSNLFAVQVWPQWSSHLMFMLRFGSLELSGGWRCTWHTFWWRITSPLHTAAVSAPVTAKHIIRFTCHKQSKTYNQIYMSQTICVLSVSVFWIFIPLKHYF